jgi:hypothetical protein
VLASIYVHIFDAFITDLVPAGIAVVVFNMHFYTAAMFQLPLILNSVRTTRAVFFCR